MKNRTALILAALLAACAVSCTGKHYQTQPVKADGLYPMTARVVELDYHTDTVTIETAAGYLYQFIGCEDWAIGDYASCIMGDMGTPVITDDCIIDVRYSGFFDYDF